MRRAFVSLIVVSLGAAASAAVLFGQAATTGKVDVQWKCTPPNPAYSVPVGDAPDHAYVVEQVKCTATRGEIAGVKNKDAMATEFVEAKGTNGAGHGIFIETLTNGDKITYNYTLTGVTKNNVFVSGSDKWTATSGTGKFKGIAASGTCTAKGTGDGGAVFDCTGTYTLM